VGDGAKIEDYAHASVSVIGAGARLGRTCMFNFCVAYPGAFVSAGGGWQMSAFGRDSFVAMTATGYDLSFGGPVRVVDVGGGRGDHARIMMTASTLCVDTVAEAEAIDAYFPDVRAYLALDVGLALLLRRYLLGRGHPCGHLG
jgi:hypothetical protein